MPLTRDHDAIVRGLVQVKNMVQTVLIFATFAAQIGVRIVMLCREVCNQVMPVIHHNLVSVKEVVELVTADMVLRHINAL